MDDSPTLHVGYGNFLLSTKMSFLKAVEHFQKSISIEKPREEDNTLIQVDIPGIEEFKATRSRIPGSLAAYFMLISCLVDMGDIYQARKKANKMEELTWELDLEAKPKVLQMCAMAYSKTGLDQKAYLCLIEAFKIFKQTKKSKENMKKKKKNVPFFLRQ
jgi:tetratricopeptide (TPR) repeat protein